jgi:gliding motility-associated-like protein
LLFFNQSIKWLCCLLLLLSINQLAMSQQYVFAQLKGAPLNTDGWTLSGDAQVSNVIENNNAELLLCSNFNNRSGAAFYSQPINLSLCNKWKAEFDFRIYDGNGADGMAFCFIDVPPTSYVNGQGLGIPATANGLKVCFDTWKNCNGPNNYQNMPKLEMRWGVGYDECWNLPTRENQDGKLSIIRSADYTHALITYDNGNISVFLNDNLYLTGFQQFNFTGYLGFTASTGGSHDNHSIKNVMIYTEMPPSFAGNHAGVSFCPMDSVQLGGPPNSNYIYSWSPSAGLSDSTAAAPFLHLSNHSDKSQEYNYFVKTAFKNNPGCTSEDNVPISVYPNPVIQFISPEICLRDALAQFADSSFTHESSTLPFLYHWNFGDPSANAGNPNSSVTQNPSHRYSASGNYPIILHVTNSKGCSDSITKIFTVNGAIPQAGFTITNPAGLCSNQPVEIINESVVDFGNITKLQIFWGDTASNSYIDESPLLGKKYTHRYPNGIASATANYTIRLIAFSGISCEQELSKQINILPGPIIQFTPLPRVCDNAVPLDITGGAQVNNLAGIFSYSGKGVTAIGQYSPQRAGADTQRVLYTYTALNSCKDSGYQKIIITPSPLVNAGPNLVVLKNETVQINASATGNTLQYKWNPSAYLNSDVLLNPICTTTADMMYELTATDIEGCSNKSSVAIRILLDPMIPSAFTPNGDGLNDYWRIKDLHYFTNCEVTIFDRYGQLIYFSKGYKNPWDGTKNGQPMTAGTYCYIIDTKKLKKIFKGFVVVIR